MKDLKYEHQSTNMNTKLWDGGGGGGVGVGGGVGYYNFPRSTNKIKSFDEILTSEKNYIFWHFSVVMRVKLNFKEQVWKTKYLF